MQTYKVRQARRKARERIAIAAIFVGEIAVYAVPVAIVTYIITYL